MLLAKENPHTSRFKRRRTYKEYKICIQFILITNKLLKYVVCHTFNMQNIQYLSEYKKVMMSKDIFVVYQK